MDRRAELERLVRARSKLELEAVADGDVLGYELGFDSQALLALLLDVEDAFQIEIPPERVSELAGATFGSLVSLVRVATAAPGKQVPR